jgi:hypothetical protein
MPPSSSEGGRGGPSSLQDLNPQSPPLGVEAPPLRVDPPSLRVDLPPHELPAPPSKAPCRRCSRSCSHRSRRAVTELPALLVLRIPPPPKPPCYRFSRSHHRRHPRVAAHPIEATAGPPLLRMPPWPTSPRHRQQSPCVAGGLDPVVAATLDLVVTKAVSA